MLSETNKPTQASKSITLKIELDKEQFNIARVLFDYTVDGGENWYEVEMDENGREYQVILDDVPFGTHIVYFFRIIDVFDDVIVENNEGQHYFLYVEPPEPEITFDEEIDELTKTLEMDFESIDSEEIKEEDFEIEDVYQEKTKDTAKAEQPLSEDELNIDFGNEEELSTNFSKIKTQSKVKPRPMAPQKTHQQSEKTKTQSKVKPRPMAPQKTQQQPEKPKTQSKVKPRPMAPQKVQEKPGKTKKPKKKTASTPKVKPQAINIEKIVGPKEKKKSRKEPEKPNEEELEVFKPEEIEEEIEFEKTQKKGAEVKRKPITINEEKIKGKKINIRDVFKPPTEEPTEKKNSSAKGKAEQAEEEKNLDPEQQALISSILKVSRGRAEIQNQKNKNKNLLLNAVQDNIEFKKEMDFKEIEEEKSIEELSKQSVLNTRKNHPKKEEPHEKFLKLKDPFSNETNLHGRKTQIAFFDRLNQMGGERGLFTGNSQITPVNKRTCQKCSAIIKKSWYLCPICGVKKK